jgi:hypothetical protein
MVPLRRCFQTRTSDFLGDGLDAPLRHLCAKVTVSNCHLKEASVEQIITIGLDITKHVFRAVFAF